MYPYTPSDNRRTGAARRWQPAYPPAAPAHWDTPPAAGYAHVVREWRKPSVYPYDGSWAQTPATPAPVKRRRTRCAGITAGVAVVAAVASAIVWWPHNTGESGSGSPAASPAASAQAVPLPVSAMDELLLTRTEAGEIFGTGPMSGRDGRSDRVYSQMAPHRPVVDDDCNHGTPALAKDHEGSGWQAVRQQFLTTQNTDTAENARSLVQGVVNFPDAATAQQFVETSKAAWQRCANRSVNLRLVADTREPNEYWKSGDVAEAGGGIRMSWTREGQNGWACQDSMTPHNNIVVELELCGRSSSQPVDEVITQITEKIETAK